MKHAVPNIGVPMKKNSFIILLAIALLLLGSCKEAKQNLQKHLKR